MEVLFHDSLLAADQAFLKQQVIPNESKSECDEVDSESDFKEASNEHHEGHWSTPFEHRLAPN